MNPWVPLSQAATMAGRSHRTLRTWVHRGDVSGACRVRDRAVVVFLPHVIERTWLADRRHRRVAA